MATALLLAAAVAAVDPEPPNAGDGAGTVPVWNPMRVADDNRPLTVRVLVLNYDPVIPSEKGRLLHEVFKWRDPARMATDYRHALEYASGGAVRFEIVEFRNLNEIYAQVDGSRYQPDEYVFNRRNGKGWHNGGGQDYPRLLVEQRVPPLVDDGRVDEVWIFSDHFFGLLEGSMAGPGAFYINGGVYPQVPSRRPFAFYGFNYERAVAEMLHNTSHRTEATLNRFLNSWNLADPQTDWDRFSANDKQSNGKAGVGTCHWPANANGDYDYGNERVVQSWADEFLTYPNLTGATRPVSRATWSKGPDYHTDYMKWYFAHLPRAPGASTAGKQNNWWKYLYDFENYTPDGHPRPARAELLARDGYDDKATSRTIRVAYYSPRRIAVESLGDGDLAVTGPDGKPLKVTFAGVNDPTDGTRRFATYRVEGTGKSPLPRGAYTVSLRADQVRDGRGPLPPGPIGAFQIRSTKAAPLAPDRDTGLLLHFSDSPQGVGGRKASVAKGITYRDGIDGKGARFAAASQLQYPCAGHIDPAQGTIEFWIRPAWNGHEKRNHVFFRAGRSFDNGLILQIDGASNVRLMQWGDDPDTPAEEKNVERGVGFSGAGWKADEWHHVAATWSAADRVLAISVDGREAAAAKNGVRIPKFSTPELAIGGEGPSTADAVFDELRISTRVRTAAEIRAAHSAALGIDRLELVGTASNVLRGSREALVARGTSKAGTELDATADVEFSSSDPAVATVDRDGVRLAHKAGTATITARLGALSAALKLTVVDPGLPQARLANSPSLTVGGGPVELIVEYTGGSDLAAESIGFGDVRVAGPDAFQQFPDLVRTEGAGQSVRATYRLSPPGGAWRPAHRGEWVVEMKAFQVRDDRGQFAPESVLGRFRGE